MKPVMAASAAVEATDEQLVEAARAGSDEAFEALFRRYRDRMTAYVRRIVGDAGRAEDIVQEAFMSALRSMRASDREILFRPWMFQIAKNACIDHLRSARRAEEVSINSEDFRPHDEGRLAQAVPGTETSVSRNEEWNNVKQAFGGLPDSQREILALRELGGLSYEEIGGRVGLSRSAVESVLFRARRGIKHEYDEIATGERCRTMRQVIAEVAEGLGTIRDRRKLLGHVRECVQCRREVAVMGLSGLAVTDRRASRPRRAVSRVAGLFPFPIFFRPRPDGPGGGSASAERAHGFLSTLGSAAGPGTEQTASLVAKTAALVAAVAIVGGGVGGVAATGGFHLPSNGPKAGAGGASSGHERVASGNGAGAADARTQRSGDRPGGGRSTAGGEAAREWTPARTEGRGNSADPGSALPVKPGEVAPLAPVVPGAADAPQLMERLRRTLGEGGSSAPSSPGGGQQQTLPPVGSLPGSALPDAGLPGLPNVGGALPDVAPKVALPLPKASVPSLPVVGGPGQ